MKYFEMIISCNRENLENIESILVMYPGNGWDVSDSLNKEDLRDSVLSWATTLADEEEFLMGKDTIEIKAYFQKKSDANRARKEIETLAYGKVMDLEELEDTDYANAWKKYYHGFLEGNLYILPAWEETPSMDATVVRINPGMAFGSGTHESTLLCLRAMQKLPLHGFAYDVGCGSGILGIASLLLGMEKVLALDIDSLAIDATKENAKLNHVEDKLIAKEGSLLQGQVEKADFIFGNLIAEVVCEMIPQGRELLRPNGKMILSGILEEKQEMVKEKLFQYGMEIEAEFSQKEWVALLARRREDV